MTQKNEGDIKLLPCPFCGAKPYVFIDGGDVDCMNKECSTNPHSDTVEYWNTRAPNENQPPLAEKTPSTPQLSCQSEGNREKELEDALEFLQSALRDDYDESEIFYNDRGVPGTYCMLFKGKYYIGYNLLETIQNAMNSQGGKP